VAIKYCSSDAAVVLAPCQLIAGAIRRKHRIVCDLAGHPQYRSRSRAMRRIPIPLARAATIVATLSASLPDMRRPDLTCPDCNAGYRRIEMTSKKGRV
jgi:hypothetical protein